MNTPRRRLNIILALSALCLSSSLRAAAVETGSLTRAIGMIRAVPSFRRSVLFNIGVVSAMSSEAVPNLSPIMTAEPTDPAPWHAEATRLVVALAAHPQVVADHQDALGKAFGGREGQDVARVLKDAAARLQARAAGQPALAAQLENLRRGLDLNDPEAVQEFGARLNVLFENSKRSADVSGGAVAAANSFQKQMPADGKLRPANKNASDSQNSPVVAVPEKGGNGSSTGSAKKAAETTIRLITRIMGVPGEVAWRTALLVSRKTLLSPAASAMAIGVLGLSAAAGLFFLSAVDAHRAELMAIPGVVAVKARSIPDGNGINDHYVLVEMTTLDAENLAHIPKLIEGFRVETKIVRSPNNI